MSYRVAVKDGRNKARDFSIKLSFAGLKRCDDGEKYVKTCRTKRDVERIKNLCARHGLKFMYDNSYAERDSSYRQRFFSAHKPDILGKYFCCYCGRLYPREKITVDHLYPVGAVSQNMRLQRKLSRMGIENINDERNLVAACASCNSAKGKKLGAWIRRGRIGRHRSVWIVRWALRITILSLALYIAFYVLTNHQTPPFIEDFLNTISEYIKPLAERLIGSFFEIMQQTERNLRCLRT